MHDPKFWIGALVGATLVALVVGAARLGPAAARSARTALVNRGWFLQVGPPLTSEATWYGRLVVRRLLFARSGLYRSTGGHGHRWVSVGHVRLGRTLASLALPADQAPTRSEWTHPDGRSAQTR